MLEQFRKDIVIHDVFRDLTPGVKSVSDTLMALCRVSDLIRLLANPECVNFVGGISGELDPKQYVDDLYSLRVYFLKKIYKLWLIYVYSRRPPHFPDWIISALKEVGDRFDFEAETIIRVPVRR